jgi:hypothetical protein
MKTKLIKQKNNNLKIKEAKRAVDEMKERFIYVPWEVCRLIGIDKKIQIYGDEASLSKNCDFGNLEELRSAIQWLAYQFGGKVKWENKNIKEGV